MNKLKSLSKAAAKAAKQPHDHDLKSVVDDLRAKNLLGGQASKQTCSRAEIGEELYEKLHRVCARLGFFGSFDRDTLERILACATVHELQAQETVFSQHEPAESMFVILQGSVALFHRRVGARRRDETAQHSPLSGCAVQALISGDHNHSASPSPAATNNVDWLQEETNPDPSNAMLSSALAAPRADRGLTGFLSIIDWACEFVDVNRWKRYFCTLLDGKLRYYASPDAPLWLGEITLAGVTACANIEKDTVGYNRAAAKLNDSEMAELRRGAVFALVSDGHLYLFDTRSKKDTTVWIEHIRQHMPAASHVSGMENKKDGVKHSKEVEQTAHQWKEKTKQLGNRAWPDAFTLFGEPLRHLLAGETCGESAFFDHRFRSQTALALEPCVLVELHCESLLQRDLLESVMPGSMWMFLNNLLRHEPMERMNTEVDYILTAVNYMPFFHQLPTNVQRSMLEVCTCHAVPDGPSVVLGRYAGPFNATSSVPLYIVLQGKIEIYQGHTMLKEGIEALGQAGFQDIHRLFPQKVQRVHAEEAWGGPQLIQESDNQKLCRMLEEVVHEVDQKKVKALRSLIKEHIDSTTYTVVAEEGTHYLQIEQSEWSSIFAQVRNVVFRTSSLFRILQKTPRERTPQQAHLAACLLHGYVFFQQLPFRNILDLAYTITLITVEAGTVLAKEGTALNRVLIVLAGTATLHKSPSANNLRLPIGPGKNVTLEDARVFFGPVGLTICAGDSFGMAYVFAKGSTPSHSLVASSRCHLLQISAEDFRAKVGKFTNDFTPLPDAILVTIRKPAKARMPSESHDLAQCLGTVGLLRQCPTRLLDELKDYVTVEGADAGAILQAEGDKTQALNVIISGSASIHSHQYQGVTGPRGGDDNELGSPTPSDLSMKWGMCENVIQVGGSFGDLILTTGLPRSNTVIAREPCQYIRFDKDNIPALAFEDLRDFVASNQGVPPGLKKSPDVRSDYDLVQGAGFLSKFEYFRDYSLESMAKLSKIAEYLTFDKGDTIQTNNTTILGTFLFLVHGGKVELRPQEDVSSVLFAGLSLRNRPSNSETQRTSAVCSSVASACLKKIATEGFQDRSDVLKAVESALRKSSQLMSPEKKMVRSRSSVTHSLLDPTAGVEATKPMEEVSFLEYGKHFILGHAMAFERTQLVRINLAAWRGIVLEQVESELSSKVTFLSQMKAFASWKHKDLAALAARTKIVKFPKNAPVIMKGQALTTILYIVKAGACSLHGTLNLAGTQCVDMAADDKLYSTSRPQVASIDEDYSTKITNRKLFPCPICSSSSLTGGSPKQGKATRFCDTCQGTGSIRSSALSKTSSAALTLSDQHVEVSLCDVAVGSIVNAVLDQTGKPLDHSIIAGHGCEMYSIETKDLLEICNGNQAMLQGLKTACGLMEHMHSHRQDVAREAHTKLHQESDLLVHPRPKEDLGGEKPNEVMLKKYQPQPVKTWSKALGSLSMSRCGQKASKLLNTQLPDKQKPLESPAKSVGEKRSAALSTHNMDYIKAKHAAADALTEQSHAESEQEMPQMLQSRGHHHELRNEGGTLWGVEEDREDVRSDAHDGYYMHTEPRRIESTLPGGYISSGGEDDQAHDAHRAISFWDETGKHETMAAHLDMDLLLIPGASRRLNALDEDEEENRRAQEVYNEALGSLMNLHRNLLRTIPKTRSKSQLGAQRNSEGHSRSHTRGRSNSVLPSLTNFDAMQQVYSDLKGLDAHRVQTGPVTGWKTAGDQQGLHSLPHLTPKHSKGMRGNIKGKHLVEQETSRVIGTPTVSIQVVDFGRSPAAAVMQKTKIPRGRQRGLMPQGKQGEKSPAQYIYQHPEATVSIQVDDFGRSPAAAVMQNTKISRGSQRGLMPQGKEGDKSPAQGREGDKSPEGAKRGTRVRRKATVSPSPGPTSFSPGQEGGGRRSRGSTHSISPDRGSEQSPALEAQFVLHDRRRRPSVSPGNLMGWNSYDGAPTQVPPPMSARVDDALAED